MYMYLRAAAGTYVVYYVIHGGYYVSMRIYEAARICMPDQDCIEIVKLLVGMTSEYSWPE